MGYKDETSFMNVHKDLSKIILKFQEDFEKKYRMKPSVKDSTRLIAEKIRDAGGLVVG